MTKFIHAKNLKGMFINQVYEYHLRNYCLQQMIQEFLPELWNHVTRKLQMKFEMITCTWIMTIFTGFIQSKSYILAILDSFIFEEGSMRAWRRIYCLVLSLLSHIQSILLKTGDIMEASQIFSTMQHTQEFGFSAVDHLFKLSLMYQEKVTIGLC
jgi:hypothetical protein